jgi:diacylglycerol O-acyltransferase / wax synthase
MIRMQQLRGLDSMFLSLESSTNLFQVGAVTILDPSTAPPGTPAPYEALREVVERRLDRIPPFRCRMAPVPFGLDHPRWVEDAPDLDRHIRRGALPAPGGEAELAEYAAEVLSRPLDRTRPLWEIHLVEGLEGGLVAGVAKIHHSAIDGIAGTEVTGHLMDLEPQISGEEERRGAPRVEQTPSNLGLLRDSLIHATQRALPTARFLGQLPLTAARMRIHNRKPDTVPPPSPFRSPPRTPLQKSVGAQRALGLARIDRADVAHVREATGATVNDVVLAITSAALRDYLEERGALPEEPLVAFVPVSIRSRTDTLESGTNRLSGMLVSLATDVSDPLVRLSAISESTNSAKDQGQVIGHEMFSQLADLTVPALLGPAGRLARAVGFTTRLPPFNVVVSGFPGPNFGLYCAGAEMMAYHPFGPVIDGAAVNVTAMSYKDQIGFGVLACRDAVTDADAIARSIPEAMRELSKAVEACHRKPQRPRAAATRSL